MKRGAMQQVAPGGSRHREIIITRGSRCHTTRPARVRNAPITSGGSGIPSRRCLSRNVRSVSPGA